MNIEVVSGKDRYPFDAPVPKVGDEIRFVLGAKETTVKVEKITYVLSERQDRHKVEVLVSEV